MVEHRDSLNKEIAYLAGGWNKYCEFWKDEVRQNKVYLYYDPETDSNQTTPDKYFPEDIEAIRKAEVFIGYAGYKPSEAMFVEAGIFYATHVKEMGRRCEKLIIVWPKDRQPDWALPFLKEMGRIVNKIEEI